MKLIQDLWIYRGFILGSVVRELQSKYRNSLLGALWTVLNTLAMMLVYTVIFSGVMKSRLPGSEIPFSYSIFLCSGILFWGLFAEIVTKMQNVFIDNSSHIKKLFFPRACLIVIVVLSSLLNFSIIFSLFICFLLLIGAFPGLSILAVPALIFLVVFFAVGLGLILAVLNVFFRDVGQFFNIFLQFWFWLTPIVYPITLLPVKLQFLVNQFNPLAPFVYELQQIFLNDSWPHLSSLWLLALSGPILLWTGFKLYRSHGAEMVDEL
jgi:lipopolysaccharide transport system permease protein